MTKLITAFTLFVITFISAQGQQSVAPASAGQFEQGMGKHLGFETRKKYRSFGYSKELPLLNDERRTNT
jgi:hypothetical protein